MAKKIIKGVKKVAGAVGIGKVAKSILGGKKNAPADDGPLNPLLTPAENADKETRATMRKRAQTGSGTILSDTLG
ncbi:hypothetical protein BSL82_09560 [Tardibacter chloracetimidivorans]|uniref:Uncharacterized protein n=1 Tax=Tardibacter chloracetimidivorans TaxID=1921510 RepID=A0A1L3ZV83_9SPHN|nr:hypothetical protein [Tardibacter chloracetimidivorans]API59527.1 hypothetical protein BSL82_09560 [Tardibacter chloracetimidivorans]